MGGAGGNAVRRMIASGIEGATLVAANTDLQALDDHPADLHVVLGRRTTRGLGAGGRPSVGLAAAQESMAELRATLSGADLVFVAAGLGGGTGTGAAPLVAHLAREQGALVVGVVTMPFEFEGGRRRRNAEDGLAALEEQVDSLLVIPNEQLLLSGGADPSVIEAFRLADAVLCDGVRGIGDLVTRPGLINLDFADVSAVLSDGGRAVMGVGTGHGPDRAARAVEMASRSPLLRESSIEGARGVLMCFTVDARLGLGRIHEAAARVQALVHDDAEILFGVAIDPTLDDEVRVTVVAAGLEHAAAPTVSQEIEVVAVQSRPYAAVGARRRNALVMLG